MGLITSHPYHEIGIFFSVVYHSEKPKDKYFKNIFKDLSKNINNRMYFSALLYHDPVFHTFENLRAKQPKLNVYNYRQHHELIINKK